jgi:hypothetical protein
MPATRTASVDDVLSSLLRSVRDALLAIVSRIVAGRMWHVRAMLVAVALAYLTAFPSIDVIRTVRTDATWTALLQQFAHPFQATQHGFGTHEAKTAFRLTVPVLAHVLGFGFRGAIVLQVLSGVAVLWLSVIVGFQATRDRVLAALCAFGVAGTFAGVAAFTDDYRGLFDGVAYALLLGALWRGPAWATFACVFLAAYTDERALLASTLVLAWWWLEPPLRALEGGRHTPRQAHQDGSPWGGRPWFGATPRWPAVVAVLAAWAAYGISRLALIRIAGLQSVISGTVLVGPRTFVVQIHTFPFGIWTALETLWIPVIAALLVLGVWRRGLALVLAIDIAAVLVVGNSVSDVTRSVAYVLPAFFIAVRILAESEPRERLHGWLVACSLLAVAIPTYYTGMNEIRWYLPAPLQILRMIFYSSTAA